MSIIDFAAEAAFWKRAMYLVELQAELPGSIFGGGQRHGYGLRDEEYAKYTRPRDASGSAECIC